MLRPPIQKLSNIEQFCHWKFNNIKILKNMEIGVHF
jgi:hypothetical protein